MLERDGDATFEGRDFQYGSPRWGGLVALLLINGIVILLVFGFGFRANPILFFLAQLVGVSAGGVVLGYWVGYAPIHTVVILYVITFHKAIKSLFGYKDPAEIFAAVTMLALYFGLLYGAAYLAGAIRRRRGY
jgi:hypothetical protein